VALEACKVYGAGGKISHMSRSQLRGADEAIRYYAV
jgi:hypothetical protein